MLRKPSSPPPIARPKTTQRISRSQIPGRSKENLPVPPVLPELQKKNTLPKLWLWLAGLLVLGVIIIITLIPIILGWLKILQAPLNAKATPVQIQTFQVQRTAPYTELQFTVLNAQYATMFNDDLIHSGVAVVRLNMQVANKSADQVQLIYYDDVRLLAPKMDPIAPTNVNLVSALKPGTSQTGWIDFAVAKAVQLNSLSLQLGSSALGESLVTMPFTGSFDPAHYADRTSPQSGSFSYNYYGHMLIYHLTSIDIRFAYNGTQTKAGQLIYILNFKVDNENGIDIKTGFAFDYVRMKINGTDRAPFDTTLPDTFKANSKGTAGHVVFYGPPGLKNFTLSLLSQNGSGPQNFDVGL